MKSVVITPTAEQLANTRAQLSTVVFHVCRTSFAFGLPAVTAVIILLGYWRGGAIEARYYYAFLIPFVFPAAALVVFAQTFLGQSLTLDDDCIKLRTGPFVRRISWKHLLSIGFLRNPRNLDYPIFHADTIGRIQIRFDVQEVDVKRIASFIESKLPIRS